MRNLKTYLSLLFLGAAALTSCQDDFDDPALETPSSDWLSDSETYSPVTIAELKTKYWQAGDNYYTTIGTADDGKRLLLSGTVISSDASGNIYKSLVIQDETGALAMSINANSMNVKYRRGQQLVLDLTDMVIGKYSGLQQLGFPEESTQYGQQTTFMPYEFFEKHVQMNGLPDLEKVDTIVATGKDIIGGGDDVLIKWQSQLVRFNNCSFVDGGTEPFGIEKENTNRILTLEDGTQVNVRTSGYSNFYTNILPKGNGDVVGILGYYAGSSDTGNQWQLTLIDAEGCMNFGNPTVGPGAESNPYTVDEAIAVMAGNGSATQVWTSGYIVGAVAPGVSTVSGNTDIQFTDSPELDNTLVIAQNPDCTDWTKCIVISLPQNSALRKYGNLADNKGNYKKEFAILGNFGKQLGTWGITGNNGSAQTFRIEGVTIPDEPGPDTPGEGDGTEAKPYTVAQAIALGNPGSAAWVKGYIVGWVEGADIAAGSHFSTPSSSASNVLIADNQGETNYKNCMPVQLVAGTDIRAAVNLMDNPANLGKELSISGDLAKYFNQPGIKAPTSFKLDGQGSGDTPTPPVTGDGDGSEKSPYSISQTIALGNPGTEAWIEGYIVGWVEGADISAGAHFETPSSSASNILLAATPSEKDVNNCVPVQLVAKTDIRSALNLMDHPENLGKKLAISGKLEKYFGKTGLKTPTAYKLDGSGSGSGSDTPTPPVTGGDGSEQKPYGVAEAIALANPGTEAWVEGVIVGCVDGASIQNGAKFEAVSSVYSNILIAPSADCKDYTLCIPVQLVAKTDIRSALNLGDNPGNLGKTVKIKGKLEKYFGTAGLKSPSAYELK